MAMSGTRTRMTMMAATIPIMAVGVQPSLGDAPHDPAAGGA
jgi:hypothetical protein